MATSAASKAVTGTSRRAARTSEPGTVRARHQPRVEDHPRAADRTAAPSRPEGRRGNAPVGSDVRPASGAGAIRWLPRRWPRGRAKSGGTAAPSAPTPRRRGVSVHRHVEEHMAGYRDTLNLPRTEFPMKADLLKREPERLAWWKERDLYRRLRAARAGAPGLAPARRPAVFQRPPPHGHGGQQDLEGRRGAPGLADGLGRALRARLGQPRHAHRDPRGQRVPREEAPARPHRPAPPLPRVRRRVGGRAARRVRAAGRVGRVGDALSDDGHRLRGGDPRIPSPRWRSAASSSAACAPSTGARPTARRWPRPRSSTRTTPRPRSTCPSRCARIRAARWRAGPAWPPWPGPRRPGPCPRTSASWWTPTPITP